VAQHTWSDDLDYHPHLHICITDGVFTQEGEFYSPWDWKPAELKEKLRRKVLKALVRWKKLSPEAADIVASWELHKCGFSLFIDSPIPADDRDSLGRLIRYLLRSPISFKRLEYREQTGQVTLKLKRNREKVFPHALDFLAALSQHVPRARAQTVTYSGWYANCTGNLSKKSGSEPEKTEPTKKRWIPWSTLILKCWGIDPEDCPVCGIRMKKQKPIYERQELEALLKSLKLFGYPVRPPPGPPKEPEEAPSHSRPEKSGTVVHLFPEDNFNQCPPGW
jgi:hypothetical protein